MGELTAGARLDWPRWWPGVMAWALWALVVIAIPVAVWLNHLLRQAGRSDLVQLVPGAIPPTVAMVSATTVGVVLANRRPHHPVGWLLLALGLSLAAGGVAAAYVAYGLVARPDALPAAGGVARYYPATVVAALPALSFVLLLTPTGSLASPRWRWWGRVTVAAPVTLLVALVLARGPLDPRYQALGGPLDFRGLGGTLLVVNQLALAVSTVAVVVAAGSLVVRFRRARGIERQQLRWVALAAALVVPAGAVVLGGMTLGATAVLTWASGACVAVLPVAIGAAILHYRLYDLDQSINLSLVRCCRAREGSDGDEGRNPAAAVGREGHARADRRSLRALRGGMPAAVRLEGLGGRRDLRRWRRLGVQGQAAPGLRRGDAGAAQGRD
jgi:hypothetical protein